MGKKKLRRLMPQQGICAKTKSKFMATNDSKYHLPELLGLVRCRFFCTKVS